MPTTHPADACPSLHVLAGTLGLNSEGDPLYPSHVLSEKPADGRCLHCRTVIDAWQAEKYDADPHPEDQPVGHQHAWSRPIVTRVGGAR